MITRIETKEDMAALYHEHIIRDFNADERRPLRIIQRLMREGYYTCYILREDGRMLAYACLIHAPEIESTLLDYFAVVPESRSGGVGGRFLAQLREICPAEGIILECEMPSEAKDDADRIVRERRIAFYERNGAELIDCGWHAFGVEYNLLWLPVRKPLAEADPQGDIQRLYDHTMPEIFRRLMTRQYPLED